MLKIAIRTGCLLPGSHGHSGGTFKARYPAFLILAFLLSACSTVSLTLQRESVNPDQLSANHWVSEARDTVTEARHLRVLWRDTESHFSKAKNSLANGKYQAAINNAQLALDEARLAINQSYLERAKSGIQQLDSNTQRYNSTQRKLIETIRREIRLKKGQSAYRHLMDLFNNGTKYKNDP